MFGQQFYNSSIRKTVIGFGSIFNDIRIKRAGQTDLIRVPLSHGPKEKFIRRLQEDNSMSESTQTRITLPFMGFEIGTLAYDPDRARNRILKRFTANDNDPSSVRRSFTEIPYNLDFTLSIMVRYIEDGLQIVEQILPFFNPHYTVSLNFNTVAQNVDVPFLLNGVENDMSSEGDFEDTRIITFTLSFTAKTYLYGPIKDQKIIRQVQATIFNLESLLYGGSSGPDPLFENGWTGETGIVGATGAMSRTDVIVPNATDIVGSTVSQTDIFVRGNNLAAGLCAGGGCGPSEVGPWFIDVFGITGGFAG